LPGSKKVSNWFSIVMVCVFLVVSHVHNIKSPNEILLSLGLYLFIGIENVQTNLISIPPEILVQNNAMIIAMQI